MYWVVCKALFLYDGVHALKHAPFGHLERARDADALFHVHTDLLLGDPAVDVFQDFQRRFGVTFGRSGVQHAGQFHLAIRAAFKFGKLRERVELAELPVLAWQQPRRQRQRVALQTFTCGRVDRVQSRFRRFDLARFVRNGVPGHFVFIN